MPQIMYMPQNLGKLYFLIKHLLNMMKLKDKNNAADYYTMLGDDVIETLDGNFLDIEKPLWLNLGYWKNAKTYPEACTAMTTLVGEYGNLAKTDTILDVGFGYGDQDFVFAELFDVSHITGINITQKHVEIARKRAKARDLENKIDFRLGSATDMDFEENSFDKVIALESAFHFNTREDFFKQAFRVLKPGGCLITADMLPAPGKMYKETWLMRLERRACHVPQENFYDRFAYEKKLRHIGFADIAIQPITNYVFPGMAQYSEKRLGSKLGINDVIVRLSPEDIGTCKGVDIWEKANGISDYILARAYKK